MATQHVDDGPEVSSGLFLFFFFADFEKKKKIERVSESRREQKSEMLRHHGNPRAKCNRATAPPANRWEVWEVREGEGDGRGGEGKSGDVERETGSHMKSGTESRRTVRFRGRMLEKGGRERESGGGGVMEEEEEATEHLSFKRSVSPDVHTSTTTTFRAVSPLFAAPLPSLRPL